MCARLKWSESCDGAPVKIMWTMRADLKTLPQYTCLVVTRLARPALDQPRNNNSPVSFLPVSLKIIRYSPKQRKSHERTLKSEISFFKSIKQIWQVVPYSNFQIRTYRTTRHKIMTLIVPPKDCQVSHCIGAYPRKIPTQWDRFILMYLWKCGLKGLYTVLTIANYCLIWELLQLLQRDLSCLVLSPLSIKGMSFSPAVIKGQNKNALEAFNANETRNYLTLITLIRRFYLKMHWQWQYPSYHQSRCH